MAEVKSRQFQFVVSNSASLRRQDKREIKRHAARQSVRPRPTKATHQAWLKSQLTVQELSSISTPWTPVPAKVGNELSWVKFPMEMSPYMVRDVARFFTIIMDTLYPSELCQLSSPMDASWIGYLLNDPVVVHAILFCAASVLPTHSTMTWNTKNTFHHLKSLQLLQRRFNMSDGEKQISDATLLAIVILVLTAQYLSDGVSDVAHVNGLYKVADIRGGIDCIGSHGWGPQDLVAKMCRVDLGHALRYNLKPHFFRERTCWKRCTNKFKGSGSIRLMSISELLPGIDGRLADIWDDLAQVSHQSNIATRTDLKFTRDIFNDMMVSIQYRLHHIILAKEDRIAESLRIAMLVISSVVYLGHQLQPDARDVLAHPIHDALEDLRRSDVQGPCKVAFWLVMVWKSLVTSNLGQKWHGAYLHETVEQLGLTCWEEAQKVLRSLIWIEYLQDRNGTYAFEKALKHTSFCDGIST